MRLRELTRFQNARKGMVLIAAALTIVLLIGMLGLAFDLARLYTARNELQAYVDAASIAAAFELNGTSNGLNRARDRAYNYPAKWNFQNSAPQNITIAFSETANGTYMENPPSAAGIAFARVAAEANVRMYFLPGFSTLSAGPPPAAWLAVIARDQIIRARATSGQFQVTSFSTGLLPYSPDAHQPNNPPNYGLQPGQMYTLRWPPNGQRSNSKQWCDGDEQANYITPGSANERGFIDIAGNGSSDIRNAIVNNAQTRPVAIGDYVVDDGGNRGTASDALRERFNQDTDTASQTYQQYLDKIDNPNYNGPKGNGRRVVIVPIRNGWTNQVLVFGGFFLHGDICSRGGDSLFGDPGGGGQQNSSTCCGEYIGPVTLGGHRGGSNNVGAYQIKLFQ